MSVVNFVCCVCVEKNGALLSINEVMGADSVSIWEKLRTCAPSLHWTEQYQICDYCLPKLNEAYNFILQCIESDGLRDKLIRESVVIKIEDDNIKWSCQYCYESFATKSSVKRHMIRKHTKKEETHTTQEIIIENQILEGQERTTNNELALDKLDIPSCGSELEENEDIKIEYENKSSENKLDISSNKLREKEDISIQNENQSFLNTTQTELTQIQKQTRWPCEYCDETFATRGSVKRHIIRRHTSTAMDEELPEDKPDNFSLEVNEDMKIDTELIQEDEISLTCKYCKQTFATRSSVRRHILRRHKTHGASQELTEDKVDISSDEIKEMEATQGEEISPLTCKYCKQTFTARSSVRRHIIRVHTPNKSDEELTENKLDMPSGSQENEDQLKFEDDVDWTRNEISRRKKRSKNGPFKCPHCYELFDWEKDLSFHKNSKHRSERPFHCRKCNSTFVKKPNLVVHVKQRHNGDPREYVCSTCDKRCTSQATLNTHIYQKHLNKREFQCEKCGKGFNSRSSLIGHRKVVHIDPSKWPYPCNICNKRFALKSGLDNHIKRHMGIKNIICHICSKCFIDNHDLKKHLVSHSQERSSYPCTICKDKVFLSTDGFRKHLAKHHNIGQYKTPERKFRCHLCPKAFPANNKLQKHIRTHTGEKPFVCEHCGKRFIDNSLRRAHILSSHKILIKRDEFGKELHLKQFDEPMEDGNDNDDDPVIAYNDKVKVVKSEIW